MVITIGRQHGSNGHLVAKALSERLGIPCFDKEIVDYAGNCCLVYLRYTDESEKEKTCLISLRDEKTGEILTEKTFNVKDMENADR